ncbi:MAG: gliding motility-associated C-terminal domain-containing protein [Chitinophagales bacterium]
MLFCLISNSYSLFAQETFFRTFSSNEIERGTSLLITSDNHLIITGTSTNISTGNTQIIVIKTNMDGKTLWTKKYGSLIAPEANVGVLERTENQLILCATTHQALNTEDVTLKNAYVLNTDKNGNILWEKIFGSIFEEEVMDISDSPFNETTKIGMTALVNYQGPNLTAATFYVDSLGNPLTAGSGFPLTFFFQDNNPSLDIPYFYKISSFINDDDRNFIRIGTTYDPLKPENMDAFIWGWNDYVVMGGEGEDILYRSIGLPSFQKPSLYINVGYSTSYGNGSKDIYINTVEDSSSLSFVIQPLREKHTKTFSTPNHEVATDILFADANKESFIVAGYMESPSSQIPKNQDVFLMKIDSNANILWAKAYPQLHNQMTATTTSSLSIAQNGDIFLVGTQKEDNLSSSIFLLKTDNEGVLTDCSFTDILFSTKTVEGDFQSYLEAFDSPQRIGSPGILTNDVGGINPPINICIEDEMVCGTNDFSLDTITIEIGEQVVLNTSDAISYQWTPMQSLNNPSLQTPSASPLENTLYEVTLTDAYGCTKINAIFVEVLPIPIQIAIPTAFTPNQDGYNDVFHIEGKGFEFLQLTIYNRWGKKVFETTDSFQSWDGMLDFETQPMGIYAYFFQYQTIGSGILKEKAGFVSLLY